MNKVKHNYSSSNIKMLCALMFIVFNVGCTSKNQTITGKVVDESGTSLSGVAVKACYSGWGWSNGYLVWDKNYCSETFITNNTGMYVINFIGPDFIRLRVKKDGWIQTMDFNATDSRIILTKSEVYSARAAAEENLREKNFRQRLPDELDFEYYCRVVLSRNRSINLNYNGETLSIVPSLLKSEYNKHALFAVRASSIAANLFANEVVLKINGQSVNSKFSFRQEEKNCKQGIQLIKLTSLYLDDFVTEKNNRFEILVPSIRALFDIKIWIEQEES